MSYSSFLQLLECDQRSRIREPHVRREPLEHLSPQVFQELLESINTVYHTHLAKFQVKVSSMTSGQRNVDVNHHKKIIFFPLIHFPNICNRQGWTRLKSGARNFTGEVVT